MTLTQAAMMYSAMRQTAQRDETFVEIMKGPAPLTKDEIRKLVEKNPERYSRYARFAEEG